MLLLAACGAPAERDPWPAGAPPSAETVGWIDEVPIRCEACGEPHYYPRPICPFCGSDRTTWLEASGRGTIYSYSVFRRAPVPYAIAYVTLEEGPTMMTNIVDADLDAIRIGQRVRVRFSPTEGGPPVPTFAPA